MDVHPVQAHLDEWSRGLPGDLTDGEGIARLVRTLATGHYLVEAYIVGASNYFSSEANPTGETEFVGTSIELDVP